MGKLTVNNLTNFVKNSERYDQVLKKLKFLTVGNGNCVAELKVEKEHTNPMGGLHGGLSATLVDNVSTYALMSHANGERPNVSVNMQMEYLKSAKEGDEILIDAKTLKAGKTLAFLAVEIKNKASGDVLVRGSHTKFLSLLNYRN